MPKKSHVTKYTAAANVIAGLEKRWRAGDRFKMSGKVCSREELVALFRSQIEALDAIRVARAALAVAVARERVIARRIDGQVPKLRLAVVNRFGEDADVLGDFGWTGPKKLRTEGHRGGEARGRREAARDEEGAGDDGHEAEAEGAGGRATPPKPGEPRAPPPLRRHRGIRWTGAGSCRSSQTRPSVLTASENSVNSTGFLT